MTARVSEVIRGWLGWCPNAPRMRTAPAVLLVPPETIPAAQSKSGGPAGRPGRIRDGIGIAVASMKALVQDRQLLWFTFLSGFVMLFLVLAEGWSHRYIDPVFPVEILVGGSSVSLSLQYLWVIIPLGDSHFIFYFGLFLIELVCLSGLILVLAGLVLYRYGGPERRPAMIREMRSVIRVSFFTLAALSVGMAFLATVTYDLVFNNLLVDSIIRSIMEIFWLPFAYYEPDWTLGAVYSSASFFSLLIMALNVLLFLASLYLVPGIVLDKKKLLPAFAGSVPLLMRTWREVLGCILVFGLIALGVFAVGLLIGWSPALVNNDLDLFISRSRGYFPMMAVCYGFLVACWILMAACFTAAGVAIADLYRAGKGDRVSSIPENNVIPPEPVL
jgi:hypothetical protein